jgi:hypothetical protein
VFNIAKMQQIDNRICFIKGRTREDSILPLESAFPWLPEYWWSDDKYGKPFETVLAYEVVKKKPESKEFKRNWIPSIVKKFYAEPLPVYEESITTSPGIPSVRKEIHTLTVLGKYVVTFDPKVIADKYNSVPAIIGVRFVNYCHKAEKNPNRVVFGFNETETKCFIVSLPLNIIKKHDIEVLDAEVETYFRFSTK